MNILSIMVGHGVSAAVVIDGQVVVAITLDRLSRKKNDMLYPINQRDLDTFGWKGTAEQYQKFYDFEFDMKGDYSSVDLEKSEGFQRMVGYVLEASGLTFRDVHVVVYSYRYNSDAEAYFRRVCPNARFIVPEHHNAHACQAFLPSGFDEAAILVLDGQGVPLPRRDGDQLSGCLAWGKGNAIDMLHELPVRYSLGSMYSEFNYYCGFKTNEECKMMGLASYGTTEFYPELLEGVRFDDVRYHLGNWRDLIRRRFKPLRYLYSLNGYREFLRRMGKREPGVPLMKRDEDMAHAAQKILEDIMVFLANRLHALTGSKNLCIAGGVGLNCVANYKILEQTPFEKIFIYPNAGDGGLAVGQALYVYNILEGNKRNYIASHDYLGREYAESEVAGSVQRNTGYAIEEFADGYQANIRMAQQIAMGKITARWEGRSEFGPRALGNRSIIADPRAAEMKDILNARVKFRESFRPFTPSVLAEKSSTYFTLDVESPFMLLAPYVHEEKKGVIPAVTHVDGTARVQSVTKESNPKYYHLIEEFEKISGIPVLLNTSFNVAGEPIVETPEDAIRCFLSTDIDVLSIGRWFLTKKG